MGAEDGTFVQIGGDSKPLVQAASEAEKALANLSKAIRDMNKEAGDSGKSLGGGGKEGLDQYRFSLDSLTESALKSMGSFGGFMVALNSTIGVVTEVASVVGEAVDGFLQLAETIGGAVVDAVRMAGQEIANLTEQVFELNKQTEQNTGSWRFIYGGAQNTADLMAWTSQFSMQVPYTRQDLMGAITALGRAGFTEQQVKDYMSTVADLGALNPQRDLTGAAWSIQGAMHGYSRMLKYDYGISPDDLYKFGYDESNAEATLMPALQAYLKARGLTGSAKWASTNTFWGAESSFIDRLQNFGLEVGGTSLNGTVTKGSMFGILKDDLTALSKWWDDHGKQIGQIADFFKNILGGAFKDATAFMQGFMDGLQKSGFETFLEGALKNLGDLLNSKEMSAGANSLGALVGKGLGALLLDIGLGLEGLFKGLKESGAGQSLLDGLKNVVDYLSDPKHQQDIEKAGEDLGKLGFGITLLGNALNWLGTALHNISQSMDPSMWQALEIVLAGIAIIVGGVLVMGFSTLLGLLFLLATPLLALVGVVWLIIQAFQLAGQALQSIADALKGIHWPTFSPTPPGQEGPPPVPGGTGPTTSTGGGNAPMVAFAPATNHAVGLTQMVYGGSGGGNGGNGGGAGSGNGTSYANNTYGGHSTVNQTFHGVSELQMERVAKRVIAQNDQTQNILSRRSGGYRPGVFGSIG